MTCHAWHLTLACTQCCPAAGEKLCDSVHVLYTEIVERHEHVVFLFATLRTYVYRTQAATVVIRQGS